MDYNRCNFFINREKKGYNEIFMVEKRNGVRMEERGKKEASYEMSSQSQGLEKIAELRKKNKINVNTKNVCVCICNDGEIGLFIKVRAFDIGYSLWVDVYYGIDSNGFFTNRIAIWAKTGDKVFPQDRWLKEGEFIVTRAQERIEATCSIGRVVTGQEIFNIMRKNTEGMYCRSNEMTSSDIAQLLKNADRYLRFEKPEHIKKKVKK